MFKPTQLTRANGTPGLSGQPESWVTDASRYILMHDPSALPTYDGSPTIFFSHLSHGVPNVTSFSAIHQRCVSPILFVDGHVICRDFTRLIQTNQIYSAEPTAEWIWYKPAQ